MKYWWCIFDNVPSVPGTQLRPNECIPVEVCTPVCSEWGGVGWGAQKSQDLASFCSSHALAASPLSKGLVLLHLSPPMNKCRGRGRIGEKRKKHYFPDLLSSKLRFFREWYFSHCSFPVTMGSKKAFFKKSFFSQFMAEHPVASSKMK